MSEDNTSPGRDMNSGLPVDEGNLVLCNDLFIYKSSLGAPSLIILLSDARLDGYVMTQLVEAVRYKPEGRGFDSRWCHWNFSLT